MHKRARKIALLLGFLTGAAVFWFLRVRYWLVAFELPFSDMSSYERLAIKILQKGSFAIDYFWQTKFVPVTPLLRAIQIFLLGRSLFAWRVFLATLTFISLGWLSLEIKKTTRSTFLALILVWVVALSKSSIFWSLKLATEGVAEMLTYAAAAAMLSALRKRTISSFFSAGIILALGFLNRPAFLVVPLLFALFFPVSEYFHKMMRNPMEIKRVFRLLAALLLGISIFWLPWIMRSYFLYGKPCLLNTYSAMTFFWDFPQEVITLKNGTKVKLPLGVGGTRPLDMRNDYEYLQYGNGLVLGWLKEHYREYPRLYLKRARESVCSREILLTNVSRERLFTNGLDWLLLDKSPFLVIGGFAGMAVLWAFFPSYLYALPLVSFAPWCASLLFWGSPRFLEPGLPLIFFGNTGIILLCVRWVGRRGNTAKKRL
jgi:hypothetical protein